MDLTLSLLLICCHYLIFLFFKDKDGKAKAEYVRKLHEQVKAQIEKKTESYAKHANKGRKRMVFEPGDWVWVHMRKERFPSQRKSKLQPRGDGPFQVVSKINDNAYKIALPGESSISATFNVADLTPFDVGEEDENSRSNSLKEGGDDEDIRSKDDEALQGLGGPMTRARAKRAKDALNQVVTTLIKATPKIEANEPKLVNLSQIEA